MAVNPDNSKNVLDLFSSRNIDANIIGKVTATDQVVIEDGGASQVLFDFQTDEITGIRYKE